MCILKTLGHSQKNGISQKLDENGTKSTWQTLLGKFSPKSMFASFAARNSCRETRKPRSVPTTATSNGDTKINLPLLQKNVLFAAKSLKPKNGKDKEQSQTKGKHAAEVVEVNLIGKTNKVYNITVDEDHVYYAGGLLVANCSQALRWLYFQPAELPEPEQHYNFECEKPQTSDGYFGGEVTESYLNGGW
jgi:hypothetical protein